MTIKVTDAMIDAAYKWAQKQSSMVDLIGEDELKGLCREAFLVMWNAGYKDYSPVKAAAIPVDGSPLTAGEGSDKVAE
jgi:hypothetical protein